MGTYYNSRIVKDGLVFCIDPASDRCYSSGSKTFDLINNQSGTLTNGASFSPEYAGGFDFDGIDDFIDFGSISSSDPISLAGLSDITIEAWLLQNFSGDDYQRIIDKSTASGGTDGYAPWLRRASGFNGDLEMKIGNDNNDWPKLTDAIQSAGKIYWLCFVRNISHNVFANDYTLFRNGSLYKTENTSAPAAISSATAPMRIANWPNGNDRCLNGSIYTLRIYNRSLTEKEVLQNYNATRGRYEV